MLTRSFHRPRTSRRVTCSISIDDARCVATSYVIDTAYFFYDDQVLSLQFSSGDFLIIGSFVSFLHFSSSSVSSCEGRSKVGRTHARALTHTHSHATRNFRQSKWQKIRAGLKIVRLIRGDRRCDAYHDAVTSLVNAILIPIVVSRENSKRFWIKASNERLRNEGADLRS